MNGDAVPVISKSAAAMVVGVKFSFFPNILVHSSQQHVFLEHAQ